MTPERQRIVIAEACGWTEYQAHRDRVGYWYRNSHGGLEIGRDILNDLNAMHEARKSLTLRQSVDYCAELAGVILRKAGLDPNGHCGIVPMLNATASEQAEAFLRTIGKWEVES